MADYIYLLETRLSPAQQKAIGTIRTAAREQELTLFLTGGAVRDLTGGGSIRDLDLTVQGEVARLREALEQQGAEVVGENRAAQQLFFTFSGGVRVELSSAMAVTYPKPGQPVFQPATLADDLRRRDFTANAMAISLNDGSYGLLMDPLNGVADIENRELRLVSNYGFIEDPSRLIRAARLVARLGWQMEERTRQRYDTAKDEGYISALPPWSRGYELEELFHEEDPVRVMRALESESWMTALSPVLGSTKANVAALSELAERQGQLQTQGIFAQAAALAFPLVTAKLSAAEVTATKQAFVREGFVREIEGLDARTREFASRFGSKELSAPSAAWKLLHSSEPNLILSLFHGVRTPGVQGRLKTFLSDSPGARQRVPYALMQEMRITSDLPEYNELVEKLFFQLMDGKLSTPEEMKAYLEPYSPPAPPPPLNLRRARAKKEARPSRAKAKKAVEPDVLPPTVAAEEEAAGVAAGLMERGTLTGPDRGTEPTRHEPLAGKVAPAANASAPEAPRPAAGTPGRKRNAEAAAAEPAEALPPSQTAKKPSTNEPKIAADRNATGKTGTTKKVAPPPPVTPKAGKTASASAPVEGKLPAAKAPAKSKPLAPAIKAAAKPAGRATSPPARDGAKAPLSAKPAAKAPVKAATGKTALAPSAPARKPATPQKAVVAKKAPAKVVVVKAPPAKKSAVKTVVAKKAAAKKATGRR